MAAISGENTGHVSNASNAELSLNRAADKLNMLARYLSKVSLFSNAIFSQIKPCVSQQASAVIYADSSSENECAQQQNSATTKSRQLTVIVNESGTSGSSYYIAEASDNPFNPNSLVTRYVVRLLNLNDLPVFDDKREVTSKPSQSFVAHQLAQHHQLTNQLVFRDNNLEIYRYIEGQVTAQFNDKHQIVLPLIHRWHLASYACHLAVTSAQNKDDNAPSFLNIKGSSSPLINSSCSKQLLTDFSEILHDDSCRLNMRGLLEHQLRQLKVLAADDLFSEHNFQTVLTKIHTVTAFEKQIADKAFYLCHGDINWHNVIVDQNEQPKLIDFECAVFAPFEYDIAMYIAINDVTQSELTEVLTWYRVNKPCSTKCAVSLPTLNNELIQYYLTSCYLLNGLWYLCQAQKLKGSTKRNSLVKSARQQLSHCQAVEPLISVFNALE